MNNRIKSLADALEVTLQGRPWYGKPVYTLLDEADPGRVFLSPAPGAHRAIDILYHMVTWATFVLHRVEGNEVYDQAAMEQLDWREIDPSVHGWEEGIAELVATHQQILAHLREKDDSFLEQKVDFREYNFHFLINGLMQHNIYHAGQVAYLAKQLEDNSNK